MDRVKQKCPACEGKGYTVEKRKLNYEVAKGTPDFTLFKRQCWECKGKGKVRVKIKKKIAT